MTYPTREHEELLRRALRVAADSVEPAGDGLERIRARLTTPRPAVAAWMMSSTESAVLRMRPLLTSMRPLLTSMRQVIESALDRLWAGRGALRLWAGRGALRLWAGRGALRLWASRGALRTHPAWLRPAAAMAAFVVIIGSGAIAIRALQHTIRQTGVPTSLGISEGTSSGQSGGGLNSKGHKVLSPVPPVPLVPLGVPSLPEFWPLHTPTGTRPPHSAQPTPLASPSCSVTTTPPPTLTPSPPPTTPVSPTPTSGSPSPTATGTGSPTPTASPTVSPAASSAGAVTQAVAATPLSSGAGSTSGSPAPGVRTGTC
jgi:cell division septation protein DedD